MVFESEYDEQNQKLRVNFLGSIYGPSIEDYPVSMATAIDKLMEIKKIVRLVLAERREYEYDFKQTKMLLEIANVIEKVTRGGILSINNIILPKCESEAPQRYSVLRSIMSLLRYDPIDAYKRLLREQRHLHVRIRRAHGQEKACLEHYMEKTIEPMVKLLENCELIQLSKDRLAEHKNRELYRRIFHPSIKPNFMYTRYVSAPPANAELLDRYKVDESEISIYSIQGKVRKLYHIVPPEFRLGEAEYGLLDQARLYIGRHEPREFELTEPERVRENLYRIGIDLITDIARTENVDLSETQLKNLATILTRYTAGLGALEMLLQDGKIQDIEVNAPIGTHPIYIFHGDYLECETNLVPSLDDAESWATRFRLRSGRPLDEANPVLDTEISVPGGRARVAAITRSLSPDGLGFAFRRHREKPWTFPLFINTKMMDSFAAGLLWFIIDGSRTMLIAGTRSSGKTALLGSCLVQIMPKIRILTVEDTLELPVEELQKLSYNIGRLKSRSVITHIETELPAEEALRTALRLGDSALIVGEVRSKEAAALYEAMRIGALANVVAGTIHGESAYGVFDRVVNDLKVPPTSFKATDLIVVANMLRSPDGLHSFRRVIEMTEVRKHWKEDPASEGGFVNLLEYSAQEDVLKQTRTLTMGESIVLNDIASRVREWRGRWDAVWENINLRANIFQYIVEYAKAKQNPQIMEAPTVVKSNAQFHLISNDVKADVGSLDSKMIFDRWKNWLRSNY